ncbi:MAG: hypothetical protein HPZ91_12090 [Lentisphaeria bacterium]|nr:hypothetical protein [Lentisphaeria bacterium]
MTVYNLLQQLSGVLTGLSLLVFLSGILYCAGRENLRGADTVIGGIGTVLMVLGLLVNCGTRLAAPRLLADLPETTRTMLAAGGAGSVFTSIGLLLFCMGILHFMNRDADPRKKIYFGVGAVVCYVLGWLTNFLIYPLLTLLS